MEIHEQGSKIVGLGGSLGAVSRASEEEDYWETPTSSGAIPMIPMSSRKFSSKDLAIRFSSKARSKCLTSRSSLYAGARRLIVVSSRDGSLSSSYLTYQHWYTKAAHPFWRTLYAPPKTLHVPSTGSAGG
jgi:hypothetical protein